MPDCFLPDYGLYLLGKGGRPETRLVFFELPVEYLTRPDLRTVCLRSCIKTNLLIFIGWFW